ncbi:hypothetical protein HanXRQr2_Chr17g0829321 [Helianthus annuus]|uniref:Uncharacterized protein n=1 Tax=Helianthus annuus TaxID=4232 RepID=A0A9K3GW69_HELAN|nr:hypothetical protein HanXRQr2_Chr17g0829321 [Helianthus annuus]
MYESGSSIKGVYFSFGKIIDYLAVNQDQRWKETSAKQSNGSSSP